MFKFNKDPLFSKLLTAVGNNVCRLLFTEIFTMITEFLCSKTPYKCLTKNIKVHKKRVLF